MLLFQKVIWEWKIILVYFSSGWCNDKCWWRNRSWTRERHLAGDETAYTLDTYSGHSLDTCDILHQFSDAYSINIWPFQHILWFISVSWCTSNIACWSHSHCDLLPIALQCASHLFHPSYLQPIISLEIEVFSLISHGHRLLLWYITKAMTTT